jgi:hypothetical protein
MFRPRTYEELLAPMLINEAVEECGGDPQAFPNVFSDDYSKIRDSCVTVDPALEEEDAELFWDVRLDGSPYAAIEAPDAMIVSMPGWSKTLC